ncbi:MAG: Uncharacterized protein CEN87_578 [Parcubacteria group bacterium Licking1014_1]|nr:MAG: Uncharacterized protein CEN87_578 [Parcubacteria group bacterium Licking1014_1]
MKKIFLLFTSFLFLGASFAGSTYAVCPVCVVAVGAGLGMSRWLGIDDLISSMWIGALLVSLSAWTIIWLSKKGLNFKYSKVVIPLVYYLFAIAPLYYYNIIGHSLNTIFGIDKIIFGTVVGTIIFMASLRLHNYLKRKNNFKSYFPYQKVVLPIFILLILSVVFYFLI